MWHIHAASPPLKPVVWLGDSLRALRSFPSAVQKQARRGIATPQTEIDLIKRRLKQAVGISEGVE